MEMDETNFNNYFNKYWFVMVVLLLGLYIYNYTIYVIFGLITIYVNTNYADKIKIYKSKIIDYIYDTCTGYLGNGSFDPLPKAKK